MPTYDYICNACGHEFEFFQSMTSPVKRKCPECGRLKLERLIGTGAGVIFKGGGFYETDYRSESYKKAADAEKKAADGKPDKKGSDQSKSESGKKGSKKDTASGSRSDSTSTAKPKSADG